MSARYERASAAGAARWMRGTSVHPRPLPALQNMSQSEARDRRAAPYEFAVLAVVGSVGREYETG